MAALLLPSTASATTATAGHVRVAIDSEAHTADYANTASRSKFVILQEWEYARMATLKAANPGLKVLMYKDLSAMSTSSGGYSGTAVTTNEAAAHPEWYLKNTSGQNFTFGAYNFLWAADIGNVDYQNRWAGNVSTQLKAHNWDGVFVDDTNPTMQYHYNVTSVAKYPSDAAYSAATGSALALIGPRLQAEGKLVIPNFGDWRNYRSTVGEWLKYVSGGMEEQFTKHDTSAGSGYFTGADWDAQLAGLKQTQAMGKIWLGIAHSANNDAAAARYGWATTLLGANGSASFALHPDYTTEQWFPEYDYDIGDATGQESKLSSGVHKRVFARGLVLVNPTNASVTVSFGARYHGSGLASARSAVMAPHTGLILLANTVAAPAKPTFQAVVSALPAKGAPAAGASLPAARAASVTVRRSVRRALQVRVVCHSTTRPCRRLVTVLLRQDGKRARVGHRKVTLRRTAKVSVRLDARGRAALAQGRRLSAVVRAQR
jgi:hypothetical protein